MSAPLYLLVRPKRARQPQEQRKRSNRMATIPGSGLLTRDEGSEVRAMLPGGYVDVRCMTLYVVKVPEGVGGFNVDTTSTPRCAELDALGTSIAH